MNYSKDNDDNQKRWISTLLQMFEKYKPIKLSIIEDNGCQEIELNF